MKVFKTLTLLIAAACFSLPAVAQDRLVLSAQSLRNAQIVLPQTATPSQTKFAELLAKRLQQSLGQNVATIAEDKAAADKILFHIGPTKACLAAVPEQKSIPAHAYIVRCDGKSNIYFAAADEFAVGFAVVEFADKVLNIRQYMPGTLGECITESQSVTVPAEIKAIKPDLASVYFSGIDKEMELALQLFKSDEFHHNFYRIFPAEKYGQSHPEYYPEADGKRGVPSNKYDPMGLTSAWQPCLTNPDVFKITLDYCLDWFRKNPGATSVSIAVNDGGGWCKCDKCKAEKEKLGNPESNLYYDFANRIARALNKEMPGKMVGFIAYGGTSSDPPSFPIEKNVLVYKVHPEGEGLAPWGNLGASTGVYTWLYGSGYVTPRYFPHEFQKYLKKWEEQGAKGLYAETYPNWIADAPMLYIVSKVARNINVDIDALIRQYAKDMYGPAADEMFEFYQVCERAMGRRNQNPKFADDFTTMSGCTRGLYYQFICWRIEDVEQMDKAMEKGAAKLTSGSIEAQRMSVLRDWWSYSRQFILVYKNSDKIAEMPLADAKDLDKAGPVISSILENIHQLVEMWTTKFRDISQNIPLAKYYRYETNPVEFTTTCMNYIDPEIWPVVSVDNALLKANKELIKKLGSKKAAQLWQDLAKKYPKAESIFTSQKTIALGKLENLIPNSSFEKLDPFETRDTVPFGFMCWQTKNSYSDAKMDDTVAHTGKYSWRHGEGTGAWLHYNVTVMPNARYLVSYWVRKAHPAKDARATMVIAQKDIGKVVQIINHVSPIDMPANTWQKQEFIVSIPELCDRMTFDVGCKNYVKGDNTWIDDMQVSRIY